MTEEIFRLGESLGVKYSLIDGTLGGPNSTRHTRLWQPSTAGQRSGTSGNCSSSACNVDGRVICFALWLELAEDCNLNCVFCYNPWRPDDSQHRGRPLLKYEVLVTIVSKVLARLPIDHVTLSGGEPLLYRDLVRLTQVIKQQCSR